MTFLRRHLLSRLSAFPQRTLPLSLLVPEPCSGPCLLLSPFLCHGVRTVSSLPTLPNIHCLLITHLSPSPEETRELVLQSPPSSTAIPALPPFLPVLQLLGSPACCDRLSDVHGVRIGEQLTSSSLLLFGKRRYYLPSRTLISRGLK